MSPADPASDATGPAGALRITSGSPTPEEVAAVTAVLAAALEQLAEEAHVQESSSASAWERSRRGLRRPLTHGDWRGFGR